MYPGKMRQKSKSSFVSLKMEDPASNTGIISIYKVCIKGPFWENWGLKCPKPQGFLRNLADWNILEEKKQTICWASIKI